MEAIQTLFRRFDALWGTKWRREENNPDFWASALADFSFAAVDYAAHQAPIECPTWPPSLAEFLSFCRAYRGPLEEIDFSQPKYERLPAKNADAARAAIAKLKEKLKF